MAVGAIPAHNVDVGGTVDVSTLGGYFSDPDGDALTYSGSSSNDAVATVNVEGSTATVAGVARGAAVITITAADPAGLQANHGFNVTVGQSGIREATVAIFGLSDVRDRSRFIDPTNVAGNINVILDVRPNDETVTGIALTLGEETIQCRGASSDMNPVAGIAESGGRIGVDCFFDTDAVSAACVGMQLDPAYSNGDYHLGAFITTDEGETRSTAATQPITLKNSGFVIIAHEPGDRSVVSETTRGLTFYGGPSVEGNVNRFHACPVSYQGTTVGELRLEAVLTDTARPDPNEVEGARVSFRRADEAPHYPVDDEAPFTWPVSTASWTGNVAVENIPGATEHWVENRGPIKNADGLDVSAEFRREGGATTRAGPFHFDFSAPRINYPEGLTSEIVVSSVGFAADGGRGNRRISDGDFFSAGTGWGGPARLTVSNVDENGVDGRNEVIAVGDCSIRANTDDKASTAFVAAFNDVRHISELPEDDAVGPDGGDLSDDGGLECYFAELQALEDALGNSTWLAEDDAAHRVQSGGAFGVDHTAPEVSRLTPDEPGLVVSTDELTFVAEDPRLATGEDGSGFVTVRSQRFFDGAWRYRGANVIAVYPEPTPTQDDVDIFMNVGQLGDGPHAVRGVAFDNALPPNYSLASFEFVRDTKAPTFHLGSAPPASFSAGSASAVTVTVGGSIRDDNVIDEAVLSVYANKGRRARCGEGDPLDTLLPHSRVGAGARDSAASRDIENDSDRIDFDESFLIRRPTDPGVEDLCIALQVKDEAVHADGDDAWANTAHYLAGTFTVNWGGQVPNRAPTLEQAIRARALVVGAMTSVDASDHFRDPDGDPLTYTATSLHPDVATVMVSGEMLTIRAVAAGVTTITVTASDPAEATAVAQFEVSVAGGGVSLIIHQNLFDAGTATLRDDGDFGVTISQGSPGSTTDRSTFAYSLALNAKPLDDVTITIGGAQSYNCSQQVGRDGYLFVGETNECNAEHDNEVEFSPDDYDDLNPPQNVRRLVYLSAFNEPGTADYPQDAQHEPVTLTHTVSGGGYDGLEIPSVHLTLIDSDWDVSVSDHDIVAGGDSVKVEFTISNHHPTPPSDTYTHWFYAMQVDVSNANGTTWRQTSYDRVYAQVAVGTKTGTGSVWVKPSAATGAGTITLSIDTTAAPGNLSTIGTITIKASSE
ncbi:MAG: hypothetical protein F4208_13385 [Gemmatimonadales bacterium]|nr:hypothetical protein [Gemmatimonadales bacterium]